MSDEPSTSLYEQVLASLAETGGGVDAAPAIQPPRPSAAVVPWRRRPDGGVEVFWVRRADTMPFMGGWHAFPGGGLSRRKDGGDGAFTGEPRGAAETPPEAGMPASLRAEPGEAEPNLVPGLTACALRELFEETGLLPAPEVLAGEVPRRALGAARRRLLAGEESFAALVARLGVRVDASRLVYAGRWLTPPLAPLRFDNRFFLLEWPGNAAAQPEVLPGELAAGEWIAPEAALDAWRLGEVIAAPPILHLLRVLAEEGPEAGLARMRAPREANLGPLRRVEFRPGVLMLPLRTPTLPPATHTNAYLLGGGDTVLVDPGSPLEGEIDALLAALRALLEEPGRALRAVWLTHHHPDHVGGVEAVREAFGVPVLAHPATAERLAARGPRVDGELLDGQRVELAGDPAMTIRVLHTPGHARGHLAFYDEAGGSLLTGDLVAGVGTIVIDPPEGDMDDYLASLDRLLDLAPRALFPAHGPAIWQAEDKLQEYIDHRLWREDKILTAWRDGLRDPEEMLPTVYDDAPPQALPLARRQLAAHLERLRRTGLL